MRGRNEIPADFSGNDLVDACFCMPKLVRKQTMIEQKLQSKMLVNFEVCFVVIPL